MMIMAWPTAGKAWTAFRAAALLFALGALAEAQGREQGGDPSETGKDPLCGKTVKNQGDGMGLIRARSKHLPKVGEMAPDFSLKTVDGKKTVALSSFRGKRPVVLVFGSYT